MRTFTVTLVCLAVGLPAGANAQWYADLRDGQRIQIQDSRHGLRTEGALIRAKEDSVWLRPWRYSHEQGVDLRFVRELRVHRGTRHAVGERALKGLAFGFAAGAALGLALAVSDREGAEFFDGIAGTSVAMGTLIAVPSAVVGALAGISVDIWEKVPLPAR